MLPDVGDPHVAAAISSSVGSSELIETNTDPGSSQSGGTNASSAIVAATTTAAPALRLGGVVDRDQPGPPDAARARRTRPPGPRPRRRPGPPRAPGCVPAPATACAPARRRPAASRPTRRGWRGPGPRCRRSRPSASRRRPSRRAPRSASRSPGPTAGSCRSARQPRDGLSGTDGIHFTPVTSRSPPTYAGIAMIRPSRSSESRSSLHRIEDFLGAIASPFAWSRSASSTTSVVPSMSRPPAADVLLRKEQEARVRRRTQNSSRYSVRSQSETASLNRESS